MLAYVLLVLASLVVGAAAGLKVVAPLTRNKVDDRVEELLEKYLVKIAEQYLSKRG